MNKKLMSVLSLALVLVLGAIAVMSCNKAPEAKAPIKIGAILAVTGGASWLGEPEANTVQMYVDKINAEGGVLGHTLELIIKDSQGSTDLATNFAKQLIEEDQVLAIIGPSTSGESMGIKDLCDQAGVILISCAAAETIVNPVAKYVFKTPQKDSYTVMFIYETMNELGIKKIGILNANTGFGKGGRAQLEQLAPNYGIEIVAAEEYDAAATDLTGVLAKVKDAGAEAVVNWSITKAQSIIPQNMKQIGFEVPLFMSHGFGNIDYVKAAGEAANGIIFPCGRLLIANTLPDTNPQKKVLVDYKTAYEAKFSKEVSTFGGHAYDALMILVEAIKAAGVIDKEKVRDALETLTFVGTGGVFQFSAVDHNGLAKDSLEILTVKDGQFAPYKK